ncbi:MAG: hypothetical protein DLM55_07760 [Acidimicrobiales bacterium]|nr:MAG: hypothetical protein DLM55_07760 [Acidimicrobiales bacterium]
MSDHQSAAIGPGDPCVGDSCCTAPTVSAKRDERWHRTAKTVRALSWLSLLWMTGEGVLGLVAGAAAGSISLIGWALGSAIEGLASIIVIWRFTGTRALSPSAERRAQKAVAISFFLLAPYIAVESIHDLLTSHESTTNMLGIMLTAASVLIMPALGIAKQRLGQSLDSDATAGEGVQNLLCAAQAAAVLIGLALTAAFGWWWIDPAIGLGVAAVAVHEGCGAWRGKDCC